MSVLQTPNRINIKLPILQEEPNPCYSSRSQMGSDTPSKAPHMNSEKTLFRRGRKLIAQNNYKYKGKIRNRRPDDPIPSDSDLSINNTIIPNSNTQKLLIQDMLKGINFNNKPISRNHKHLKTSQSEQKLLQKISLSPISGPSKVITPLNSNQTKLTSANV